MPKEYTYATWRTDKPKEDGFSHELISTDSKFLVEKGSNLDELYALPFEGVDTIMKAIQRNVERIPNHEMLGTRVGDKYEWMTYRDMINIAEHLSYGFVALDMCPPVEAEDKTWKFMGIQSKNRKEWVLTNLANMHQRITTVAFYDTLGPEATRFVCNQTELTTMSVSIDYIMKLSEMKIEDAKDTSPKMSKLVNLISFESGFTDEMRSKAEEAGITLYTMEEVIMKGREAQKNGGTSIQESEPDDVYMFSYTSGTTGDPKGVKLTHKMIVGAAYAV